MSEQYESDAALESEEPTAEDVGDGAMMDGSVRGLVNEGGVATDR